MIGSALGSGDDRTAALLAQGYEFTGRLRPGTGPVRLRLVGRPALLLTGPDGVRSFYGTPELRRRRAVPLVVRWPLFGPGAIHGLDGDAHRWRRALFRRVLSDAGVRRLVDLADQEWALAIADWESAGGGAVFDTAVDVYGRAVQRWAGLPFTSTVFARELARIVDGFAVPGRPWARAVLARLRCQRWARHVIRHARHQLGRVPEESSPLQAIATATAVDGYPLPLGTAATELLNVLRPTVAVAWLAAFGMLALQRNPLWWDRLAAEPDPAPGEPVGPVARACAHETRRWAPFVPLLAARAAADVRLPQGPVRRGERVLLDVHGTDYDPRHWPEPDRFDPGRFLPDDGAARRDSFVAQGGGDPENGHRCPGEPATVDLLAHTLHRLSRLPVTLTPDQDLSVPLHRMPTRPVSGVLLQFRTDPDGHTAGRRS